MYHGYVVVLAVFVDDVLIACANTHIITYIKGMFKDHYIDRYGGGNGVSGGEDHPGRPIH